MRDDFRPKFGGDGDREREGRGGVNGAIGRTESASGEMGSSRMLCDPGGLNRDVFLGGDAEG